MFARVVAVRTPALGMHDYPGQMTSTHPGGLVTLTPAPSWDMTYELDTLDPGEVHRAHTVTTQFAGKGVNVSANLALAQLRCPAVVPLNATDAVAVGDNELLEAVGVHARLRTNITVTEQGGRTTKVNQQPGRLSTAEWTSLVDRVVHVASQSTASWVLVSGSMALVDGDVEEALTELVDGIGSIAEIAVDTSGRSLDWFARSGRVRVIKPNVSELAELVQRPLKNLGDVRVAAQEVMSWGVDTVLVSLGADGFVGFRDGDVVWATTEPLAAVNTIGAGDASVAGFFHGVLSEATFTDCVARAARWGGQKVTQPGSQLTSIDPLPSVSTTATIDPTRRVEAS